MVAFANPSKTEIHRTLVLFYFDLYTLSDCLHVFFFSFISLLLNFGRYRVHRHDINPQKKEKEEIIIVCVAIYKQIT